MTTPTLIPYVATKNDGGGGRRVSYEGKDETDLSASFRACAVGRPHRQQHSATRGRKANINIIPRPIAIQRWRWYAEASPSITVSRINLGWASYVPPSCFCSCCCFCPPSLSPQMPPCKQHQYNRNTRKQGSVQAGSDMIDGKQNKRTKREQSIAAAAAAAVARTKHDRSSDGVYNPATTCVSIRFDSIRSDSIVSPKNTHTPSPPVGFAPLPPLPPPRNSLVGSGRGYCRLGEGDTQHAHDDVSQPAVETELGESQNVCMHTRTHFLLCSCIKLNMFTTVCTRARLTGPASSFFRSSPPLPPPSP